MKMKTILSGATATLFVLLFSHAASFAACTQTLSAGANIASAVSGAADGSTICLNSGSYGSVTLGGIVKSSRVTIQSVTGQGASMNLTINGGSSGLTVNSLTLTDLLINDSTTKNITVQNCSFGTNQAVVYTTNFNNNNILIDGNSFGAYNAGSGEEGRLSVVWKGGPGSVNSGVTVSNNTFGPGGCSDGIQIGSYGVVVGPGNTFTGITQSNCSVHVDSIQGYGESHTTITGNYFASNTVAFGFYDGGTNETFQNNVVNGSQVCDLGSITNLNFSHNTMRSASCRIGGINDSGAGSGTVTNNIMQGGGFNGGISSSFGGTYVHNMFSSGGNGTNNITGTPTYTGGTSPTTWAGYQLAAGSIGKGAATDGTDMGIGTGGGGGGTSDTTKPTVSITAPASGATLSGTVTVSATASDNVGVAGVQFKLDGANLGAEDTSTSYSTSWNTTGATSGSHMLSAVARDTAGNTATAANVTVTVSNTTANQAPTATPQSVTTTADTATTITLAGTDPEGSALTYTIVTQPAHGTLSGTTVSRTYTPAAGYSGSDSFTFKVNDGQVDSPAATVSITVTSTGGGTGGGACTLNATTANFSSVFSGAGSGAVICLASGSYGSFSGGAKSGMVTIQPASGASVSFSGGNFGSSVRNITIRGITFTGPVEVSPPSNVLMNLIFDGDTWGNVGHSTHEGRLSIVGGGAASGSGVQVKNSKFGPGGCSDGIQDSSNGTEIGPNNEISGIVQGSCTEHADAIQPYASNNIYIHDNYFHDNEQGIMSPDGVSTGYRITNNVIHTATAYPCMHLGDTRNGTVTHNVCRNGAIRVYGGNQNVSSQNMVVQNNAASIDNSACTGCTVDHNQTVTYTGGSGRCAYATASPKGTASDGTDIGLNDCSGGGGSGNTPPTATAQSVTTAEDTAKTITLAGTDPEGSALTYTIVTQPAHGTLSGTGANRTYTPVANYNGSDSFTFKVNDGTVDSPAAAVSITITSVNDAPVGGMTATPASGPAPLAVSFSGAGSTDIDGTVQSYAWNFGDTQTGTGVSVSHTYSTAGSYTANLTVTDNNGAASTPVTRVITVSAASNQAPSATAQSVTTAEDTAKTITLAGMDPEGSALTFAIVTQPAHGTLSGTGANRTYTPAANYNGSDSFTFKVNDGQLDSPAATVSITVTSVNDVPVANMTASPTSGSAPLIVSFGGTGSTDIDGTIQSYSWAFGDGQTGTGATLNHTYAAAGSYTAVLTVTDNGGLQDTDSQMITVSAPSNQAPTATAQSVTTAEDTAKAVTLAGTDPEGSALTYAIVAQPAHGTLSGTGANRTYTPVANYNGSDSFTFKVNDGQVDSPAAAVSITVTSVNDVPVANMTANPTSGTAPLIVSFNGTGSTDIDGTIQSYSWAFGDGQTGTGATLNHTYAAAGSYTAILTVTDNGGLQDTDSRVISVDVVANQPPTATPQSVTTAEDAAKAITLAGTDPEGNGLTYAIVTQPLHGTLSGTGAGRTYTPVANYNGSDSFTFKVNDGHADSASAIVSITVTSVNDAPVAAMTATPASGSAPLAVSFSGAGSTDIDGTVQSYAWSFGDTQTGTGVSVSHTYNAAGSYTASLTVTDNNGLASAPVTRVITVNSAANQAPTAAAQSVTTAEDTDKAITLAGTDPEGSALTYAIVTQPLHGTLSGTGAARTYSPVANYNGSDSFTFRVNDGQLNSPAATVSITVTPVNDAPVAAVSANPISGAAPLAVSFSGTGSTDIDGTVQSYSWAFGDGQTGTGASVNHTYAAAGTFTAVLTVTDNGGLTDTDSRVITVNSAANQPPVAQSQPNVTMAEDTPEAITLIATDPEHAPLSYSLVTFPAHGFLSGTAPNLTYTPLAGYSGTDGMTFRANDGVQNSNIAQITITITAVNDPPDVSAISASPMDVDPAAGVQEYAGTQVTYSANVTDPDNNIAGWQWYYTANGGSRIAMASGTDEGIAQQSFSYPAASVGDNYVWILRATDTEGLFTEQSLSVMIIAQGNGGQTTSLPAPDLRGIDHKTFTPNDEIGFNYPLSGVTFDWSFTAAMSEAKHSVLITRNASLSGAPATTSSPRFTPASIGLTPGVYQLTVTATQGNQSASASATLTLVSGDFSQVKVYPNPWRLDKHSTKDIVFANLPDNSTVKLFTVSGHKIRALSESGGTAAWDLKNDSGEPVASGIYMYLITDGQGNKTKGKVAVVK